MAALSYQDNRGRGSRPIIQEASVAGAGSFTGTLEPEPHQFFSVSVTGAFDGVVTLQRQLSGQLVFANFSQPPIGVNNWEATVYTEETGTVWRLGFNPGAYVSGTALCRLSWG